MSDILRHYASKYYDPVKAREYYLKTRELKGRTSTKGLNEEGRNVASSVKSNISAERKAVTESTRASTQTKIQSIQNSAKAKLDAAKKKLNSDIKAHNKRAMESTYKLMLEYEKMGSSDKKFYGGRIKQSISDIRRENNTLRQKLNKAYQNTAKSISKERSDATKAARASGKAALESLSKKYDGLFETELSKIKATKSYQQVVKPKKTAKKATRKKQAPTKKIAPKTTVRKTVQAKPKAPAKKPVYNDSFVIRPMRSQVHNNRAL